jgi:hypothetical protein
MDSSGPGVSRRDVEVDPVVEAVTPLDELSDVAWRSVFRCTTQCAGIDTLPVA